VVDSIEHHRASDAFCQQLFAANTPVYYSDLVRLEYAHFYRGLQSRVDAATRVRFRLHRWDRQSVRARWMAYGFEQFDDLLRQFASAHEVALTRAIVDDARQLMIDYNLNSYDAAHVAAALAVGVPALAAVDGHFVRVASLLTVHIVRDPVVPALPASHRHDLAPRC
jgi:predicted nucleic acid-binding protein